MTGNRSNVDYESFASARECCQAARALWLDARDDQDLQMVERLYVRAIRSYSANQNSHQKQLDTAVAKKAKTTRQSLEPLTREEYEAAGERLALLMCQSKRVNSVAKALRSLGFICRLSSQVLDYPLEIKIAPLPTSESDIASVSTEMEPPSTSSRLLSSVTPVYSEINPPCIMVDNFLHQSMFQFLQNVFQDPNASYWTDHHYQLEPPSPYFSYIIPLFSNNDDKNDDDDDDDDDYGGLGSIIHAIYTTPHLRTKFPRLKDARFVELWAHNRPHASGHQLHFDSDDEGRGDGGPRHPIVSTVLYLSDSIQTHVGVESVDDILDHNDDKDNAAAAVTIAANDNHGCCCGGPSLVTCQTLSDKTLASFGWLCHPKPRRLVAFDGSVLHGVIPGKGVASPIISHDSCCHRRRVTCMMAFWQDIAVRDKKDAAPGSAQPFPTKSTATTPDQKQPPPLPKWAHDLCQPLPITPSAPTNDTMPANAEPGTIDPTTTSHAACPIFVNCVYETLQGQPWSRTMAFPDYNQIFQGF